jgi:hypothetical protein
MNLRIRMRHLRIHIRTGVLLSVLSQAMLAVSAVAQDQAAAYAHDLSQLKQHREAWPAQLTLKSAVKMSIISNGKEVGSIVSPEGSIVDLISVNDTTLEIGVMATRAMVSPEETDLWQRVVPPAQKSPPSPAPASASLPSTNSTAPPPSSSPIQPPVAPSTASSADVSSSAAKPVLFNYEANPSGNFTKAAFRFWSPLYDQPIRGVIVLVPGQDRDGRGMINDVAWQDLARKYRLALVACCMQGGGYYEASTGTGDALLEAMKNFAKQSSHDEMARAPLLLYGESAGGEFNYNFVLWKPERVMAFIVNKGAYYNGESADARTRSVPGLFFLGQKDSDLRIQAITSIWTVGRKEGALWALAPQPNSGHEFSKTASVARIFFDGVLKNRLPDDAAAFGDGPQMKPMQESQGWLGDLTLHEIHAESADEQSSLHAAWLPDEASANAWKAFVSGR